MVRAKRLSRIHRAVSPHLRPEVPLFTKPLAPGLGLAEDPDNGPELRAAPLPVSRTGSVAIFYA